MKSDTDPHPLTRRTLMQRMVVLVAGGATLSVGGALLSGCGSDSDSDENGAGASGGTAAPGATAGTAGDVFVGKLATVDGLVAFHIDDPSTPSSRVRSYVCDGKAEADGGFALWFGGTLGDGAKGVTATERKESITFQLAGDEVVGTVTFGDGRTSDFTAERKTDGSGIYDVTVGADGSYDGTSTDGNKLDGSIDKGDPDTFTGTVTIADTGKSVKLKGSQPAGRDVTIIAGEYTAVALHVDDYLRMDGRSGSVRKGTPGLNIIGLGDSD